MTKPTVAHWLPGDTAPKDMSLAYGTLWRQMNKLYTVKILEVNTEKGYAMVSWNGNTPQKYDWLE